MNDDYMSEADNEVDGGYFADLEYSYQQKEIRRQEDKENKAKKEENRKQQLLRQNKCIENLKIKINKLKQQLVEKEKELAYMTKQAKKFNNEAQKYYEDAYCNSFQNQKAIAELERLKEEFNGAFSFSTQQEMFDKYIDQQIAELKGETNE